MFHFGVVQKGVIHTLAPINASVKTIAVEGEGREENQPQVDVVFGGHNFIGLCESHLLLSIKGAAHHSLSLSLCDSLHAQVDAHREVF